MIDRNTWGKIVTLEKEFKRRGEKYGRRMIGETMQVSDGIARMLEFALYNKDIIRYAPNTIDTTDGEAVGVITDVHIPYHDDAALEAASTEFEKAKVDTIVLLGDVIDFYKVSRFIKNPTHKSVNQEIADTRSFLTNLRNRFPDAKIIYKKGNHEDRMDAYIMGNASEIYELVDDLLEIKLGLRDLNIDFIEDPFRIGKLWFLHGHEKPGGSYNPEYICNVMFKYVLDHFIVGHFHRNQTKPFKQISGKMFWGGALGYLAGEMDYAKINQWNQGVAIIRFDSTGHFKPEIKTIVDGEVY
jgi:predicted phosphodiesterase